MVISFKILMVKTILQNRNPVKKRELSSENKKGVGVKMVKKSICKSKKKRHAKRYSGGFADKKKGFMRVWILILIDGRKRLKQMLMKVLV